MEEKQYLLTERAHLMCPGMNFGIKFTIDASYDYGRIQQTMKQLEKAHPFLQSTIANDETCSKLYYAYQKELHVEIIEKNDVSQWENYYREITTHEWNVYHEPLLKVIVIEGKEDFVCLFIAHHLLGDGRAVLGIVNEFANCYAEQTALKTVSEHLIKSLDDLPEKSDLPWISKVLINRINRNWLKENQRVSYEEYLAFEKNFLHNNPISFKEESLDEVQVEQLHSTCCGEGISVNDYLVAEMMWKEHTNKVVIAADIRKYLSFYQENALGNYATAFGVVCKGKSEHFMEKAREVSSQIKKILKNPKKLMLVLACYFRMNPELIDAVAISTLGSFQSKAGNFAGSMMFGYKNRNGYSITNLGSVTNKNVKEAVLIPPASPANKKTMGVLTVNGCMKKCTVEYIEE